MQLTLTSPGLAILIWDFPNIPRNENFNLLVWIKFLNLFLYTVVLNKNEIIYWSEQSFTGLRLEDQCSAWGLSKVFKSSILSKQRSDHDFLLHLFVIVIVMEWCKHLLTWVITYIHMHATDYILSTSYHVTNSKLQVSAKKCTVGTIFFLTSYNLLLVCGEMWHNLTHLIHQTSRYYLPWNTGFQYYKISKLSIHKDLIK